MKKVVFIFSFLVFSLGFASSVEDAIEDSLILKYPSISDGKTSIKVHEYDVDIDHHKIELKIEVKGDETKEKFEKLDQDKLEIYFTQMIKYIQKESKKSLPVELEVELDRDFHPDIDLYKNTFIY
ncbi:hypothetical protein [uncultured Cetobacterium sp.]|uniref:hypothetical protein n=1 Tax=uncultured Cetobacterium sp. TaxID=527638 RepID=UPI0026258C90|nr:hypothetical protein [uncultured Cetobacterium sp.]